MPVSLVTATQVFDYLEIPSPSAGDTAIMTTIVNSVVSDMKEYCRWGIVEDSYVDWLPRHGAAYGIPLRSTDRVMHQPPTGQDRLQLTQMHVTAVSEVKEDPELLFGSDTVLTVDEDWRGEKTEGILSRSGGLLRINACWSSIPLSIKVTYTAGFTEGDLAGRFNGIRYQAIKECIFRWLRRKRELAALNSGDGGLTRKEKLRDFEVQFADPFSDKSGQLSGSGLSEDTKNFLQNNGYVFRGIGV